MKDVKVVISEDRISLANPEGYLNQGIVMDKVAKDITEEYCKLVGKPKSHILDIGFGLGFSANMFYNSDINSYTCIEINPLIYEKAVEWAQGKENVEIILGDWIDILPLLDKKFDGIFMDTYGDDFKKYSLFEQYCVSVANEGCILSLFEYASVRSLKNLNYRYFYYDQGEYELNLKEAHPICWSYFINGSFKKVNFSTQFLISSPDILKKILLENSSNTFEDIDQSANVYNTKHVAKFYKSELKFNQSILDFVNKNIIPEYNPLTWEDIDVKCFNKYEKGCKYDRHIETVRGIGIKDESQYYTLVTIPLNSDFKGGDYYVYNSWDRSTFSQYEVIPKRAGWAAKIFPYQHSKVTEVLEGVRYDITIMIKHNKLIKKTKSLV